MDIYLTSLDIYPPRPDRYLATLESLLPSLDLYLASLDLTPIWPVLKSIHLG